MADIIDPKIAPDIQSLFPGEKVDFAVKAKKHTAAGFVWLLIGLSLVSTAIAFGGVLTGSIFGQLPATGTKTYVLVIALIMFFIGAMVCLINGLRLLFWNQVWYVGTDKRIAMLQKKKFDSYGWGKFYQDVGKTGTNEKGTVTLTPKPETNLNPLTMTGIANCDAIQKACHKRILDASKPPNTVTLEEFEEMQKTGTLPN